MKLYLGIALTLLTGYGYLDMYNKVNELQQANELTQNKLGLVAKSFQAIDDEAVSRENALQDALEERLGNLERDMDTLKWLSSKKFK